METFNIRTLMDLNEKYIKVWESEDLNHRILYFQLDKGEEGIPAHFHPHGEDHAIVLDGELTYDISFDQQLKANVNEIVFGWNNYVHGYHNYSDKPLHLLIFATPEHNPSVYSKENHIEEQNERVRKAAIDKNFASIASERIRFSVKRDGNQKYMFTYDKNMQQLSMMPLSKEDRNLHLTIQFL